MNDMEYQYYGHASKGILKLEVGQRVTLKELSLRDGRYKENVPATITSFTPMPMGLEGAFKVLTDEEFRVIETDPITAARTERMEQLVVPTNAGSITEDSFSQVARWQATKRFNAEDRIEYGFKYVVKGRTVLKFYALDSKKDKHPVKRHEVIIGQQKEVVEESFTKLVDSLMERAQGSAN